MKKIKTAAVALICAGILWAGDSESPKAVLSLDQSFSLSAGQSKSIDLKVGVPTGYGIVVGHSGKSLNMIANFGQSAVSGLHFSIEKMPEGIRKGNNLLAAGNAVFKVRLSELKGAKAGSSLQSEIVFNYQLCPLSSGKCLSPDGITKSVTAVISKDRELKLAASKSNSASPVKWAGTYENALKTAKSSGQNIYVIVTAPSWCGACQMMERETFAKANVQKVLNSDFVSLQVLDTSSDMEKFNIEGFPTSFVLDSQGNELSQQVGGIDASQFLSFLSDFKKTKKGDDDSDDSDPVPHKDATDKKITWEVRKKTTHSGGADWSGFLGTMTGTKEECKQVCAADDECHAFFIVKRGQLDIPPKGPNKYWKHFRPGECVFLHGRPSSADVKQSDMYYKKVNGKKAYSIGD